MKRADYPLDKSLYFNITHKCVSGLPGELANGYYIKG
jgi:hypothetical protein